MGGEKFDSTHPEGYLFGENSDLNFLGNRPVLVGTGGDLVSVRLSAREGRAGRVDSLLSDIKVGRLPPPAGDWSVSPPGLPARTHRLSGAPQGQAAGGISLRVPP